ncbi:MAG: phosphatase PAP2 family protein [Alphaproteobacteria bacterium]|nr:phosphatase PAP2 family protein [Alphaproteobacteria bacterium]MBV9373427.1 phosphatase PAP2 family protein [Alphaproteobacteria bacterium]MBV9900969.1 phosphatase PAP2 family protein [Alphaproteobacteria bacterium]
MPSLSAVRVADAADRRMPIALCAAALGAALVVGGALGADGLSARSDLAGDAVVRALGGGVALLDAVSGKRVSSFLLGAALVVAALAGNVLRRRAWHAGPLLYVGAVQLACTLAADLAKPPFGRLRPFQAAADGRWSDLWFMGERYGSFPSGHAAFYAGLFVPLALAFPRWAPPLLAVPLLVAAERILSHDHYPSDVGASFLLAALLAGGLWRLAGRGGERTKGGTDERSI